MNYTEDDIRMNENLIFKPGDKMFLDKQPMDWWNPEQHKFLHHAGYCVWGQLPSGIFGWVDVYEDDNRC